MPQAGPIRSALVLGGGSDIGAAVLARLAEDGLHKAVLLARYPERAAQTVTDALALAGSGTGGMGPGGMSLGGIEVVAETWDATDVAGHELRLAAIFDAHGPFDVVLCAVGMLGHHAGRSMTSIDIGQMVSTNFAGPAAALAVVADRLVSAGRPSTIVVLSSIAAIRARKSNYVYGSSKAGLEAFSEGLGDALSATSVRVLVVRPGFVVSKMTTGLKPAPFARTPQDVADATMSALDRSSRNQVWVPGLLGPMMAILKNTPRSVWRMVAGDR